MSETHHSEHLAEGSLISHLLELRNRLIKAVVAVLIAFVPCAFFANRLFEFVATPLMKQMPEGSSMISTSVIAPFMVPIKLALIVALVIAMPVVLYQIWSFVAPGLYRKEKRFAVPLLASSIILFYVGVFFAYFMVFPLAFKFLVATTPVGVKMMTDISSYLDFATKMVLAFGVAFEIPVATVLLIWTGIVKLETMTENRGYVLIGIAVVAALITPPDAVSMLMMAIPMYLLYELGILAGRVIQKQKQAEESAQT